MYQIRRRRGNGVRERKGEKEREAETEHKSRHKTASALRGT